MAVAAAVFQSSGASEASSAGAGDHGGAEDGDEDDDDALSKECAELEDAVEAVEAFKKYDAMLAETVTKLIDFFCFVVQGFQARLQAYFQKSQDHGEFKIKYGDDKQHTCTVCIICRFLALLVSIYLARIGGSRFTFETL